MPKIIQNIEVVSDAGRARRFCQKFWDIGYGKGKAVLKGPGENKARKGMNRNTKLPTMTKGISNATKKQ